MSEELAADASSIGVVGLDVLLIRAVQVTAARLEQTVLIGEARDFLHPRGVVIAVDHLEPGETEIDQILDHALELRVIFGAELDGISEDRDAAAGANALDRLPGRE